MNANATTCSTCSRARVREGDPLLRSGRYLRALYERLSNQRLEELRKNLNKRARYQALSSGASALVTALTYGALAYLVIDHRIGVAEAGAAVVASQQLNGQLNGSCRTCRSSTRPACSSRTGRSSTPSRRPFGSSIPAWEPFERIELDHVTFTYPRTSPTDPGASAGCAIGCVLGDT